MKKHTRKDVDEALETGCMESVLCDDGEVRLPEWIMKNEIRRIRSLEEVNDIYIWLKDVQFGRWSESKQKMIRRDHRDVLMEIAEKVHSHIFQSNVKDSHE
jgi:hypothetical protein